MRWKLILLFISLFLLGCSPSEISSQSSTEEMNDAGPSVTEISTTIIRKSSTPTITNTPKPTNTKKPTDTPTPINSVNFTYPVDPKIVPMYQAFDLDSREGYIESNAGDSYNGINYKCNGNYFIKGTGDNHFAYDFGTGNCSKFLVGTPVFGMSIGFKGLVISSGNSSNKYAFKIDYGNLLCTDGEVRHIIIQFAHSIPTVSIGDLIDSSTQIANLEYDAVEIEIMVFDGGTPIDPRLIGLEPFPDN